MLTLHQYGKDGYNGTRGRIHQAILQGEEFKTGHMRAVKPYMGSPATLPYSPGRLEGDVLAMWREDKPQVDYVIYSYATPIAWHTSDGNWVVPCVKYSNTTTRHQSLVTTALHMFGMSYDE
jgi:hypothetical protein